MTSSKAASTVVYVGLFLEFAAYGAKYAGWLSESALYWIMLYAGVIAVLVGIVWLGRQQPTTEEAQAARTRAPTTERLLLTVALIAILAFGAVQIARASGYLSDPNLYTTLNIALPVLWLTVTFQVYLRRKKNSAAR